MIYNVGIVVAAVTAALVSKKWTVRQPEESKTGSARPDLVVTDPGGNVYLIEVKGGGEPMHFASIAQVDQTARVLSKQEAKTVTPVLLTSQDVRGNLSNVAGEVGVHVVEATTGSDQEAADSVVQFLQATQS
jgi:hypothetical protein